ncbi:MAG: PLP-dependent aminotransferase family protein [Verrucomicrobia bacterium]|nr:PLP-dependent aminotransferase family protein [Verrucomicrobiota bacterium]
MKTALSALARRTAAPSISWLMATTLARPKLISLAAGFTDNASLPVREARDSMNDLLRSPQTGQPALQYGSTAGEPKLRAWTASHLQKLDGISAPKNYSADRVLITNGSQQLLYMTAEALCDAGDIVIVEDPTYFVFLGIVQSHGLRARGVRMTADGIDLAHLERVLESLKRRGELPRLKLLYLVTYFQNPTGITTGFAKKVAALKLLKKYERAAGHPIYLLEDAAYRELRFTGDDVKSALSVRGFADRVIYAGTYSKPFASGLRVGFGILPEPVLTAVTRIKGNHDFGTANLLQQTLARAIATGRYEKHLGALRRRYAGKAAVMRAALQKHFPPAVKWDESGGGLYFWARLPRSVATGVKSKVFRAALAAEVLYVPGAMCYADDATRRKPDNEMRLSYGNASEANIREGIKRLGAVLWKNIQPG